MPRTCLKRGYRPDGGGRGRVGPLSLAFNGANAAPAVGVRSIAAGARFHMSRDRLGSLTGRIKEDVEHARSADELQLARVAFGKVDARLAKAPRQRACARADHASKTRRVLNRCLAKAAGGRGCRGRRARGLGWRVHSGQLADPCRAGRNADRGQKGKSSTQGPILQCRAARGSFASNGFRPPPR